MIPNRSTLLALLLGTALGIAVAVSGGVLASRRVDPGPLPAADARLLAEVMARVRANYVEPVDDHELMDLAVHGMVAGLDAHSAFLDPQEVEDLRIDTEGNYSGIGVEVSYEDGTIVVVSPIDGSPAAKAGLRTGDVIIAIDGHEVKAGSLADSAVRLRGEPGTAVSLTIERRGIAEPLHFVIRRGTIEVHSVRQAMLAPGYGYLRISRFSETTPADLEAAVSSLRRRTGGQLSGLVLDLRNNPGGVLESGIAVADDFLQRGVIVSADGRAPDARFRTQATPGDVAAGAPMAVLVNGGSASAAEIVAAALRDNGRAGLIGRRTFGKGSVQTILPLSNGAALKLTTSHYYTPSGASIHERGIEPDVVLPRDDGANPAEDPATDPEVAAALDWLKTHRRLRAAGR